MGSRGSLFGSRWILGPLCLISLGLEGIGSSSFTFDSLAAAYSDRGGFYGRFASLRSALKGLDQARLHLTLSRQLIRIVVDSRAALSLYIRPSFSLINHCAEFRPYCCSYWRRGEERSKM